MILMQRNLFGRALLFVLLFVSPVVAAHADKWIEPNAEELKMTSQAQVPGASAVYLYREEKTDDKLHYFGIYIRLKVLTERGKEYANVELNYSSTDRGGGYTVDDIAGRTIHSDGTVVPFTGKPFDKLIEKTQGRRYMAKVFSLPSVEVGSILEYRYTLRYDDHYFIPPQWFIQSALFTRKAHYLWRPTGEQLISSDDRGQLTNTIAWTPILPDGAVVKQTRAPGGEQQLSLEVDVKDVPPAPDDELMPPLSSLTYRVLFYYSPYRSNEEFWKSEGKHWAKLQDKFIGPGNGVRAAVQELVGASDTQDQKLTKIYASVMKLENTDFTHFHSEAEEKSQGLKLVHTTDDVLSHRRGSSDQLAELFVAMARAAGMKAYVMTVVNRDRHIFLTSYFNLSQFDDNVAIVTVDGKERFFDPGSRYCAYGHLAWKHSMTGGLRQVEAGGLLAITPTEGYGASTVKRVANLTMDVHGLISGTVDLKYIGSPALRWRQLALTQDQTALEREMRQRVEQMVPTGMEVNLVSIDKVADYAEPLSAKFTIKGSLGTSTGRRIVLPGTLFEANAKPTFSHEKRQSPISFDYSYLIQDAVRINFPAGFEVESFPASDSYQFEKAALYTVKSESKPTSVTMRRDFVLSEIIYLPDEYAALRTFYGKLETKDQESIVLKLATSAPAQTVPAGN